MLDILGEERQLRCGPLRARRGGGRMRGRVRGYGRRDLPHATCERVGHLDLAEQLEHFLRARDRLARQAGEPRDVDAVAAVGASGHDAVEEHDLVVPFAHRDMQVGHRRQRVGELGELVVVRREQRARAARGEGLGDRPREREPVERAGAAADLVEDHEAALARVVQDVRRLGHLDHEGRLSRVDLVGAADAGEDRVEHADLGAFRGDERAHVREQRDERDLPDVGALARHVRSGDERERRARGAAAERGVVGDEARRERAVEHGVAAALDRDAAVRVDLRPRPALAARDRREAGERVELRGALAEGDDLLDVRRDLGEEGGPEFLLARDAVRLGAEDLVLELLELGGDVALGVAQRLLAGEGRGSLGGVHRRKLDVVAEDRVEADLERRDAARGDELLLVPREPGVRVALQEAGLVELEVESVGEHAALAQVGRRVGLDRAGEPLGERREERGDAGELRAVGGERGARRERGGERLHRGERAREGEEVTRRGAPERGAARDARDILQVRELRADGVGEPLVGDQGGDAVEARVDRGLRGERVAEPVAHEAPAHRRGRGVEDREQAALARAGAQRALDLECAQRGGVDGEERPAGEPPRRREMRDAAARVALGVLRGLRLERVAEDRAGRADRGFVAREAEALERLDRELRGERVERVLRAEVPARARGQREAARREAGELGVDAPVALLGVHDLARRDARDLVGEEPDGAGQHAERAGRDLDGRDMRLGAVDGHGRDAVRGAGVEQRVVDERARRQDAGDGALDHALRVLRILHLLADRDAVTHRDQLADVALGRVERDTRHRQALGALGQRDRQQLVREHGVAVEHLVEVAHPEEEQAIGMLLLEARELPHRRGGEVGVQRRIGPADIVRRRAGRGWSLGNGRGLGHGWRSRTRRGWSVKPGGGGFPSRKRTLLPVGLVLCFRPSHGVVAQLGERLGRIEEVVSSILIHSTERTGTPLQSGVAVFRG